MGKKPVQRPMYEEMQDTSWITGLRGIGDAGNEGILDNYNKVNVFDELTQRDLEGRVNAIYNRALGDFERDYRNTMQKTLARDYGRFGTTGATPSLYNRDIYNLQQQRKLADLQYNKAATYDDFINNELTRRYNTMNMFKTMSDMGSIPYQQDVANWQIRNMNKDRQYLNDVEGRNYRINKDSQAITLPLTIGGAAVGGYFGGPQGAQIGASIGNSTGNAISPIIFGSQQTPYGGTAGYDSAGTLLNGFNSFIQSMGGSSLGGQSWGQALGNVFGNRSSRSSNTGLSTQAYNSAMGNAASGSALQGALNSFLNQGSGWYSIPTSI